MTMRRQALRSCEPSAILFFLSTILISFVALPSVLASSGLAPSGDPEISGAAQFVNLKIMLTLFLLSAVTFVFWRYHRRDYASPRRIGRRI
jgi:uncharacterized Tic20 family protein